MLDQSHHRIGHDGPRSLNRISQTSGWAGGESEALPDKSPINPQPTPQFRRLRYLLRPTTRPQRNTRSRQYPRPLFQSGLTGGPGLLRHAQMHPRLHSFNSSNPPSPAIDVGKQISNMTCTKGASSARTEIIIFVYGVIAVGKAVCNGMASVHLPGRPLGEFLPRQTASRYKLAKLGIL